MSVPSDNAGLSANSRPYAFFAVLAGVLVAEHSAIRHALALAWSDPEYSHILLVVPIVLAFVLIQPNNAGGREPRRLAFGFAAGAIAAALLWWARTHVFVDPIGALSLEVLALVFATWSAVLIFFGWDRFRALAFPLLFLLLAVPLPQVVVGKLTWLLQAGSTQAAYLFFRLFGIPVTRHAFVLALPQIEIEVAQECSGIRSTVMLFVAALVVGQLYLSTPWRKAVLALAVLPIGIVRNGLRVFVLSTLGAYVDRGWLEGNLHHRGGIVFFVFGLGALLVLLWYLRRAEPRVSTAP